MICIFLVTKISDILIQMREKKKRDSRIIITKVVW